MVGVDNKDLRLKPGMTANVSIVVAQKDQILKVPNAALRFTPPKRERDRHEVDGHSTVKSNEELRQKTVWKLIEDGSLAPVPIQIRISDGIATEMLSGTLTEGELVVVGIEQSLGEEKGSELPPGFGSKKRPRYR